MSWSLRWVWLVAVACGTNDATPTATAAEAADVTSSCEDALPDVVATIGGTQVTASELKRAAAGPLIEAQAALHEARKNALDNLVVERLIAAETEERGITEEQLLTAEIRDRVTPPTDAEVAAFFEEQRAQMRGTLEEMTPQITGYLENQRATERMRAYITKLKTDSGVETYLEPFRVEVAAEDSPRHGSESAPIQIIEFSDFQCPYCVMAAETVREVEAKYGDKVSVVYRHFPLPMHAQAGKASEASECANDQGKFWEYHDALFADQKPWMEADLTRYATNLELDMEIFGTCLSSGKHAATVADDMEDGRKVGMGGTPGFYINGIMLTGAQPIEAFSEVIDAELAANR